MIDWMIDSLLKMSIIFGSIIFLLFGVYMLIPDKRIEAWNNAKIFYSENRRIFLVVFLGIILGTIFIFMTE